MSTRSLVDRIRLQSAACEQMGSHLYAVLLNEAADNYDAGGIMREVMRGEEESTHGSVPALRFTGALHRLVLEGRAPELAEFFPTGGGTRPAEEIWPALEGVLHGQLDEVRAGMRRTVQTNEVGRAVALLTGLLHICEVVGLHQIRLLEVGASAGLTMLFDRFCLTSGELAWGDPASPMRLVDPWVGKAPDLDRPIEVVERRGCDPNPLDPSTEDGRLTLLSYVWPDQIERIERLRGALELAQSVPAPVDRASAAAWVAEQLAQPTEAITVVWHSVVMQYVDPAERDRLGAVLTNAQLSTPLWRLSYEPMAKPVDEYFFELMAREHRPDGTSQDTVIGGGGGHGPPFRISL